MNHYDGPIRNTEQQLVHIYYTLFCRCGALLRLSPATATCAIIQHRLDFLHPILLCRITYGAPLEMLYAGIRYLFFLFFSSMEYSWIRCPWNTLRNLLECSTCMGMTVSYNPTKKCFVPPWWLTFCGAKRNRNENLFLQLIKDGPLLSRL